MKSQSDFFKKRNSQTATASSRLTKTQLCGNLQTDTKTNMNKHLRGNSNIMGAFMPNAMRQSVYQSNYQGLQTNNQVKNAGGLFNISCSAGTMIPDPKVVASLLSRCNNFKKDCENTRAKIDKNLTDKKLSTTRDAQNMFKRRLSYHHMTHI